MLGKTVGIIFSLSAIWVSYPVVALQESVGKNGIDARKLQLPPYNLTGSEVGIGQVELGRPAKYGFDRKAFLSQKGFSVPLIAVTEVFLQNHPAKPDEDVDSHAHNVAGVITSSNRTYRGVAPAAKLYSSASGINYNNPQPEECLTTQHIALQNYNDVRAINFSFGESLQQDPRPDARLDGNSLLTQCIDWSARIHDVLYIVAGNEGIGGFPIPTDNINGINIASTVRLGRIFTKADPINLVMSDKDSQVDHREINTSTRQLIHLLAPGSNIMVPGLDGTLTRVSGTSFAAPHAVGTVALLQELSDRLCSVNRKSRKNPCDFHHWSLDARRHEVMKAILINSADKIQDNGDGLRLGMTRTLIDKNKHSWLDSNAFLNKEIPLDAELGAGHLNAFRAYHQFKSGQWRPNRMIPPVGWDYFRVSTSKTMSFQDYVFKQPLKKGSFVAVTLAWDRRVELKDSNQNSKYDLGESFKDHGLNNLDIHLMRIEDSNPKKSIWSSVSLKDSVEHIFHPIPITGRYKIRVQFKLPQVNKSTQPYALAWWAIPAH